MSRIKFTTRKLRRAAPQFNTTKSKGPDGIPPIILQSCAPELTPVLNKLFQLSYNLGIFPSSWKPAHVFSIPQKGDKSDPIAIASLVSKTIKAIITKQHIAFLEKNSFLSDHQYSVRQARSTGDLLAYAVHACHSALESYGKSKAIPLDIPKPFGVVWYKDLLTKLLMLALHPTIITWITSFLSGKSIAIRVDGFLSRLHSINFGVPQSSVISPALFILFINDLTSSTSSSIFSFIDDTYLSSSISSNLQHLAYSNISPHCNTSASLLTNDLTNIERWVKDNHVKFNQGKTTKVFISSTHHQDFPPIFMNDCELDISSFFTKLGLSISSNLPWKPHIHSIAKHASQ